MNLINKKLLLFLLANLIIVGISAMDIYISSLPKMVTEFHSKADILNTTISAYTFGLAFGVLFVGDFSNKYGRRVILLIGVLAFTISSFIIIFSTDIKLIICLRFLQSLGCSTFVIVSRMILKDVMNEKEQINANGILLLSMIISPAIAPIIGAYIGHYLGWRYCFLLSSSLGLLMFISIYKLLPETNHNKSSKLTSIKDYLNIYKGLLSNSSFMSLTFIYSVTISSFYAFIGISSYLYINSWHVTPIRYSYIFFLVSFAYFLGNWIMRVLNSIGKSVSLLIGLGVYSASFGVIVIILSDLVLNGEALIIMVSLSLFLIRTGNAILIPPTQIRIMSHFKNHSAQALGFNMCIMYIVTSLVIYNVTKLPYSPMANLIIFTAIPMLFSFIVYRLYHDKL